MHFMHARLRARLVSPDLSMELPQFRVLRYSSKVGERTTVRDYGGEDGAQRAIAMARVVDGAVIVMVMES